MYQMAIKVFCNEPGSNILEAPVPKHLGRTWDFVEVPNIGMYCHHVEDVTSSCDTC